MLFKEMIAVYSDETHKYKMMSLLIVEAGRTYSYHWALKG
jgi:hypothetical protein